MSVSAWFQLALLLGLLAVTAPPLGRYLAAVYGDPDDEGAPGHAPGDRVFRPIERVIYRVSGVKEDAEQRWSSYAISLLAFSVVSVLSLYVMARLQHALPLNPNHVADTEPSLAWNTAVSFTTNTNWQSYGGEYSNGVGHFVNVVGLAVQNFVSAAVGAAVVVALIRGIVRRRKQTLGNFWVDLTRTTVRVLLPMSLVVAVVFVSRGVIQNLEGFQVVRTLEGGVQQLIPGGPVASQEAIKQLGTNGGGFFNVNAAHPFENPDAITNFLSIWALLLIPFAFPFAYGRMVKDRRQGQVLLAVMAGMLVVTGIFASFAESQSNPSYAAAGVDQSIGTDQAGGNMEGKEVRFSESCGLYAAATTGTSTGAVNCMHDSMSPLGGGLALLNMKLGEVSPGGVGVGMAGVLINALLAVFIAGLMVGRTPEYLGKKIQAGEMKLVTLYILAMPATVLILSGISVLLKTVLDTSVYNPGAHGFTEVVYAFASAANNNGSAFGGITANTEWMNSTLGIAMLVGRFFLIIPVLAIAGSLVRKQHVPVTAGTFPTATPLFAGLLTGVIVIVAGLTFFPALALGPLVEHLSL